MYIQIVTMNIYFLEKFGQQFGHFSLENSIFCKIRSEIKSKIIALIK